MKNKADFIDVERIKKEFTELVAIDSVTFQERQMADRLTVKLRELGFEVSEDEAGEHYGGNAGNLYGFLPGTLPGEPILLSAHMDTVKPGIGKTAVFREDGKITSDGNTVLGADDVAGIVEILEGIRCVMSMGIPHRSVEVLFPIGEEAYVKGTDVFDFGKIRAREAYVLDVGGPAGTAVLQAPSIVSLRAAVLGKAAHAGFAPERGVHAISAAAGAIAAIRQGRIDEETTLNVGTISGGEALNIVPDKCVCTGEVRSYDHKKAITCAEKVGAIFEQKAKEANAVCEFSYKVDVTAYKMEAEKPVVKRFQESCRALGIEPDLTSTFGGSDNNNFVKNGILFLMHSVRISTWITERHAR